ncbi:MAG TPA: PEP-CTERM sorting domain-containing protein, partial [Opitutus sp.]|nr:PEP-CTERM sorting domain-containing protein [Opitutus sp.]
QIDTVLSGTQGLNIGSPNSPTSQRSPADFAFGSSVTLNAANTFTGGTTIDRNAVVIAAHNQALGATGGVTLNQGTLAVAQGVTTSFSASHPLTLNGGRLAGAGTLAFDGVNAPLKVAGGTNGPATLSPGFQQPGKLNFNFTNGATLILDAGGNYHWKLMDAGNATGGWDTIAVSGPVTISADAIAPFNLTIATVNADGSSGPAGNFDVYSSYSWTLLTADSITGFDPTYFNIDGALFINRTLDGTFSVALDGAGTSLMLNYTAAAIPEPSTWALMIIGISAIAFSSLRRRRQN